MPFTAQTRRCGSVAGNELNVGSRYFVCCGRMPGLPATSALPPPVLVPPPRRLPPWPQNLIEYISRQKIYDSVYWKQECFGLSAERLVDKAVELKEVRLCAAVVSSVLHFG